MLKHLETSPSRERWDVLEICADGPLKVVKTHAGKLKIVGSKLLFDFTSAELDEWFEPLRERSNEALRLNTENREIVILAHRACKLSETEWLLVHRLAHSESGILGLDELCRRDEEGREALWDINDLPAEKSLYNLTSRIRAKLLRSGIRLDISFRDRCFMLGGPNLGPPVSEESPEIGG